MQKYIVLLRGINVSGKNSLKMADLKTTLEEANFKSVKTYIQSGNIVLSVDETDTGSISGKVHDLILDNFGLDINVITITPAQAEKIVEKNPFYAGERIKQLYYTILEDVPSEENINKLSTYSYEPEKIKLSGNVVYFYSPDGYGRAKMNNNFLEQKLKVPATTRNHNTMLKLIDMCK